MNRIARQSCLTSIYIGPQLIHNIDIPLILWIIHGQTLYFRESLRENESARNFEIENDHSPPQILSFLGKAAQNRLLVLRPMFSEKEGRADFSFIFNFFFTGFLIRISWRRVWRWYAICFEYHRSATKNNLDPKIIRYNFYRDTTF